MTNAYIVVDLGFGDAGKGTTVDTLCRRLPGAKTIVRFNGGAQAAHNVVTPDGRHHTFSQFGSGMFVDHTRTHLSQYMLINPANMFAEDEHLRLLGVTDAWQRTTVDPRATIITPYHKALNRLRELSRGDARHGSCGQGIGETMQHLHSHPTRALSAGDLSDSSMTGVILRSIRQYCIREVRELDLPGSEVVQRELDQLLADEDDWVILYRDWSQAINFMDDNRLGDVAEYHYDCTLIFEGAQGILLDENYGFNPYTTWSTTTNANALKILAELDRGPYEHKTIGVTRSYMTRHGAGPLWTENDEFTLELQEEHNEHGDWQGAWRCGWLDLPALSYAIECTDGIDGLVVTHLDRVHEPGWRVCKRYVTAGELLTILDMDRENMDRDRVLPVTETVGKENYAAHIAEALGVPLFMESWGPTADDKKLHELEEAGV